MNEAGNSFYPRHLSPPDCLKTAVFHIEPLTPNHLEQDYEAVMSSRTMLNLWGGHGWTTPNFTREENLADLQQHHQEQLDRVAFTYTILSTDQLTCLGCLYIVPVTKYLAANPQLKTAVSPHKYPALFRFWVRQDQLPSQLDQQLLQTLHRWFKSEAWAFDQLLLHTPTHNAEQISTIQAAGFAHTGTITMPDRGQTHFIFPLL